MTKKTLAAHAWSLSICLMVAYAVMLVPADALASGGVNSINDALCTVINWFLGPIGKAIATLAIIIIGVGALMGKVSWGMAIIVGLGVAVIFGADTIATQLGASGDSCA
jgi:type IV secretory pathway VirB2 component (pilin)